MAPWFVRTTLEERAFEKRHILRLIDKYLATDVLEKVAKDDGYRVKVERLEKEVGLCGGYLLDIGSNTAGECEYMMTRGYSVIATDINEHALSISQKRCALFGRPAPYYIACDGAKLPFATGSMACVVFNESLHHMPNPLTSLLEASRVLVGGGRVIMFEPYAYDPWRRISEVRDYFKGTIETSFSEAQIKAWLSEASLELHQLSRVVMPPSQYKLAALPPYRRALRNGYYWLLSRFPSVLGMILCQGRKPGVLPAPAPRPSLDSLLICPISGGPLVRTANGFVSNAEGVSLQYPMLDGIPVLIASDATHLATEVASSVIH
jgi:SAM-dependent methyltransferase/uncharacterized protein YbaR (Trm112 family)